MENVFQVILDLFIGKGVIIAVGTFVLGMIIKQSIKVIPNDFIPLIGGIVGIILGICIPNIFPDVDIVTAGIYGLALGWASTGGYETVRNLKDFKKEGE